MTQIHPDHQTVKLTLSSSVPLTQNLKSRYPDVQAAETAKPPKYPFRYYQCQKAKDKSLLPRFTRNLLASVLFVDQRCVAALSVAAYLWVPLRPCKRFFEFFSTDRRLQLSGGKLVEKPVDEPVTFPF
jgi:hypothetical protein